MATEPPVVFKATLGSEGRVVRGAQITEAEAVLERLAERDIVVCDGDSRANRFLARRIETAGLSPKWRLGRGKAWTSER